MESALIEASIECDVDYIIKIYKTENVYINFNYISLQKNSYNNYNELYKIIIEKITQRGYGNDILEIMPIIDDYLDMVSSRDIL